MKNTKFVLGLIILVLSIAGIWKFAEIKKTSSFGETIKLGAILSETGVASGFGEMTSKGVKMAVDEINANGGINGKKIILVSEDDRTDAKTAVGLYKKLTSIDHVDAIIGGNFDFVAKPLFDLAKEEGTVVISPMNSRIPGSLNTNKNSFTMLIDFADIVRALTPYLTETQYNKLAVVHYASGFGNEIVKVLDSISIANKKGSVVDETYNDFGTTDWKPFILRLKERGVDIVFADMLQDDFVRFVKDSKTLGLNAKFMTHNDVRGALDRKDINLAILDNVVVLNWDVLGSEKFIANFKAKYGVVPVNHASQAYVTAYILAEALAKNGKLGLADYLNSHTFKTPEGEFSFTKDNTITSTPIKVQKIEGGKLVDM